MDKIEFVEKLYNTLIFEVENREKWILPEYKDNLNQFIAYCADNILGKDISDLVFDVALGQCKKGIINGIEYPLNNLDELKKFINDLEKNVN
jgi:hypothetical protein